MSNISVIIPTFNESLNIIKIIDELRDVLNDLDYEIIVVDDNSPDKTHEKIKNYVNKNKIHNIYCINRTWKKGLSSAVIEGIGLSKKDNLCVMDGDGQHDPQNILEMLSIINAGGVDLVIGSRFFNVNKTDSLSAKRNRLSAVGIKLCNFFIVNKVTDPLSGLFITKRNQINKYSDKLYKDGFKILFDYLMVNPSIKAKEIQINFRTRNDGESKLNLSTFFSLIGQIVENRSFGLIPGSFFVFSIVGSSGIFMQLAFLGLMLPITNNFFISNAIGILIAMTSNYALNNYLTFHNIHKTLNSRLKGLSRYYLANSLSIFANVGIASQLFSNEFSILSSALIGILAGLILNYFLSRNLVFKRI
mgnify:FL=1|tara:strand:- start:16326 stop:17408 length:1083 start_codon:yes stop_codon:yes gene_type:complete